MKESALFTARGVLNSLPSPPAVSRLEATPTDYAEGGVIWWYSLEFEGCPFIGRGGTRKQAADNLVEQMRQYDSWESIPELDREGNDPAAFLAVKAGIELGCLPDFSWLDDASGPSSYYRSA